MEQRTAAADQEPRRAWSAAERVYCLTCGALVWRRVNGRTRSAWTCYDYFAQSNGGRVRDCPGCGEALSGQSVTGQPIELRAALLAERLAALPRELEDRPRVAGLLLTAVERLLAGVLAASGHSTGGLQ